MIKSAAREVLARTRPTRTGTGLRILATVALVAGPLAVAGPAPASGIAAPAQTASWPVAGADLSDSHDQANETMISPGNVNNMVTKWSLTTAGNVSATPTVANGTVYIPDWGGKLWALNATTGQVIWSDDVPTLTGVAGDISRTSPAVDGSELILGSRWTNLSDPTGARVFAVDASTGKLLWLDTVDTDPASLITGSPVVYNGVAYVGISSNTETLASQPGYQCCTFRGAVIALNATTGAVLWKTYMVPSNNGGGDSNTPGYYTGGAVWGSSPVVDPTTGMLYVGTGNNYSVPPGVCTMAKEKNCTKPIASDYFDSIVGLNLTTGAIEWADRTSVGDKWVVGCKVNCGKDSDFGSAPNLYTTTNPVTGDPETLLGIGQKNGIYWAVNPVNGKQVWHTLAGPAGPGGGILWGSATDGTDVFCAEVDSSHKIYTMGGSGPYAGQKINYGSWAELNAATGKIVWQTPDPNALGDSGYVSLANGVVYAGDNATTGSNMFALDASTGVILSSFPSGGVVRSGAAIVNGMVYWGSGYANGPNDQFYAFGLPSNTRRHTPAASGRGWQRAG